LFIVSGVPISYRKQVWLMVSGAHRAMDHDSTFYENILKSPYQKDIVDVIKIDMPRTFPENIYFEVHKNEFFNVLVGFSHQNSAVGYCQGLNYIAGLILIVTKDEQASFWLLKHLVENVADQYHTKDMFGLQRDIHVLSELIKIREPLINEKINEVGLPWAVILTKWLICLFCETLPIETVLRVWDVMFAEGYKVIFRTALAIVLTLKEDIMNAMDITELAELFRNINKNPRMLDCHSFVDFMLKIKLKRRDIDVLRNNYRR
jgi:TBC1 domain family member 6